MLVNHELSGVMVGETLATRPEDVYRALIEATAFGTRTIIDTFAAAGVPVKEFIVTGGLLKNHLLMQIYADVTGLALSVIPSTQGPALGSAIHAAVAAGAYPDVRHAAARMGSIEKARYRPNPRRGRRVRRTVRRIHHAARLLRSRRQPRDAPPAPDPTPGPRVMTMLPAVHRQSGPRSFLAAILTPADRS